MRQLLLAAAAFVAGNRLRRGGDARRARRRASARPRARSMSRCAHRSFDEAAMPCTRAGARARPGTVEFRIRRRQARALRRRRLPRPQRQRRARQDVLPGCRREPYGFSNDVGRLGAPSFEARMIGVSASRTTIGRRAGPVRTRQMTEASEGGCGDRRRARRPWPPPACCGRARPSGRRCSTRTPGSAARRRCCTRAASASTWGRPSSPCRACWSASSPRPGATWRD